MAITAVKRQQFLRHRSFYVDGRRAAPASPSPQSGIIKKAADHARCVCGGTGALNSSQRLLDEWQRNPTLKAFGEEIMRDVCRG